MGQAEVLKFAEAMDKDGNEIISKKEFDGLKEYAENEFVFAYRGVGDYFSHIFPQYYWNLLEKSKEIGLNYEEDEDNDMFFAVTFLTLISEFSAMDSDKDGLLTFKHSNSVGGDITWFNEDGRAASVKDYIIYKMRFLVDWLKNSWNYS